MATVRFAVVCIACLGVASAFMIPSAGFGLRAALPSVSFCCFERRPREAHFLRFLQAALRQSSTSKISMQALDELKLFVGGLPWAMESEELKQVGTVNSRNAIIATVTDFSLCVLGIRHFRSSAQSRTRTLFTIARLADPEDLDSLLSRRRPMRRLRATR